MSLLPKQVLPETEPIGTAANGQPVRITHNWYLLLYNLAAQVLGGNAAPPVPSATPVTLTGSPYTYGAEANGDLAVVGGLVSKIELTRAAVTVQIGVTAQLFAVRRGDSVVITYGEPPALTFFPN